MELDGIKVYETFGEWKRNSILTSPLHAWNYQQQKVDLILRSFNKEVAQQVLYSRDGLKQTILDQKKALEDAKEMAKENILTIEKLEQEILELKIAAEERDGKKA